MPRIKMINSQSGSALSNQEKSAEVAAVIIHEAKRRGYIDGPMPVIAELADIEKQLFIQMAGKVKEYSSVRPEDSLNQDEVLSLFVFVYAKAAEAVSSYLRKAEFEYRYDGMFDGRVPLEVEENLIEYMKSVKFGDAMYSAFANWNADNPEFCTEHGIHPVLPLLEALKWSFRIAAGMVIRFFEQTEAKRSSEGDF